MYLRVCAYYKCNLAQQGACSQHDPAELQRPSINVVEMDDGNSRCGYGQVDHLLAFPNDGQFAYAAGLDYVAAEHRSAVRKTNDFDFVVVRVAPPTLGPAKAATGVCSILTWSTCARVGTPWWGSWARSTLASCYADITCSAFPVER